MEKATGNRLSTPKRQVFRPPHSTYRFKNLLSLPRRLFCPPPSGSGEPSGDKKGSCCSGIATTPTVGLVRRLHRTPITEVRLQDVLDNKHLPPLTLKDFEDWLIWHQKSAENLYFYFWLRAYTKAYTAFERKAGVNSPSPPTKHVPIDRTKSYSSSGSIGDSIFPASTEKHPSADPGTSASSLPRQLREAFLSGMSTFLSPDSPLELNLPASVRSALLLDSAASPHPSIFNRARDTVQDMLQDSLTAFVISNCGNADTKRARFAVGLGLVTALVALVPVFVAIFMGLHRAFRVIALPLIWFGILVAVGGMRRTCLVIYLFGDQRQLHCWELKREPAPSGSGGDVFYPYATGTGKTPDDEEAKAECDGQVRMAPSGASTYSSMTATPISLPGTWETAFEQNRNGDVREEIIPCPSSSPTNPNTNKYPSLFNSPTIPSSPPPPFSATSPPTPHCQDDWQSLPDLNFYPCLSSCSTMPLPSPPTPAHLVPVSGPMTDYFPSSGGDANERERGVGTTEKSRHGKLAGKVESAPTFGPITKVFHPLVIRAQRRNVITGAVYGLVVAVIVGAIVMSVPNFPLAT